MLIGLPGRFGGSVLSVRTGRFHLQIGIAHPADHVADVASVAADIAQCGVIHCLKFRHRPASLPAAGERDRKSAED
ncbi:MAG: hypothetical protein ABJN05_10435 [Sulfitobacter dubius]|nr:hypothetical protein [Sulfitobacter dubius]WOI31068.1 hypothetical protein R1T39_16780 [Sulfitobacter dubius]